METTSQILAPLRYTVQQEQQRNRVLQNEEAALTRLIQCEEGRWAEVNSRLDDLTRAVRSSARTLAAAARLMSPRIPRISRSRSSSVAGDRCDWPATTLTITSAKPIPIATPRHMLHQPFMSCST
jgi:hypothetical protein